MEPALPSVCFGILNTRFPPLFLSLAVWISMCQDDDWKFYKKSNRRSDASLIHLMEYPCWGTCSLWITFISLSGCSHGLVMYVDNNCSILRAAMLWGRGVVSYREWEWDVIVILWMRSYESERTMRCETYEKFRTLFRPGKKGRIVKKLWFGAGGEYYKIIITAA